MKNKVILDLCGGTGAWSQPYLEAGYDVRLITLPEHDVRTFRDHLRVSVSMPPIHGILSAPPCDHFAVSGARWWAEKDRDGRTEEGLAIVDACLDIIEYCKPVWWALENPVGSNTVILCDVFRHELEDLCQRWQHLLKQAHKLDADES